MSRKSLSGIYRWHSVNLVPHMSAVTVTENDPPYPTLGRMYEWVWLGVVIRVLLPVKGRIPAWTTGTRGPRWSRRLRQWKWGKEL